MDTLESLMDAAVDQSVSNILLTAAIRLNGTTVALSGRARDLTISSDTASCRGRRVHVFFDLCCRTRLLLLGFHVLLCNMRCLLPTAYPGRICERSDPAPATYPVRRCLLDARGLSRAFLLSAGANLSLRDVELANCNATQGGCVLAVNGSSVSASRCFFRGAVADGDGGALLALAGSSLTLVNCACAFSRAATSL